MRPCVEWATSQVQWQHSAPGERRKRKRAVSLLEITIGAAEFILVSLIECSPVMLAISAVTAYFTASPTNMRWSRVLLDQRQLRSAIFLDLKTLGLFLPHDLKLGENSYNIGMVPLKFGQ